MTIARSDYFEEIVGSIPGTVRLARARERFPHQCPTASASPPLGADHESGKER